MNEATPKQAHPNRSLRRKSAARVAAIHALFAAHFSADSEQTLEAQVEEVIATYQQADAAKDEEVSLKEQPERALLFTLLESVRLRHPAIEELIAGNMAEGWKKERMGALLSAIATVAIAEMLARKHLDAGTVIQEYVTLTESYAEEADARFMNGLLGAAYRAIHH